MSAHVPALPLDKESLLARSAVCRLRLRRDAHHVCNAMHWKRVALGVATAPGIRRAILGGAVSFIGLARAARMVMLAGRTVVAVKLAAAFFAYARGRSIKNAARAG